MNNFDYHVFLSHSSKDKPDVRELATKLENAGLKVWLDEWEIGVGDSIPAKVQKGIQQSRHVIYVMSPNAIESKWARAEHLAALFSDPANEERRLLPLLLRDTVIPDLLKQYGYADWRTKDEFEYQRLLASCKGEKPPRKTDNGSIATTTTPLFIDPVKDETNPPHILTKHATATTDFLGRKEDLLQIRKRLLDNHNLVLVNGEGGIGKTTVAAKYWEDYERKYKTMAWIYCETGVASNIVNEIGDALNLTEQLAPLAAKPEEQYKLVSKAMAQQPQDCLLVLDNANDETQLAEFNRHFTGTGWHILLTSRTYQGLGKEKDYAIEHLPEPLAIELFKKHYNEENSTFDTNLKRLLKAVGYNTLCVEMYAKYLAEAHAYTNLAELLTQLEAKNLFTNDDASKIETGYDQKKNKDTVDNFLNALYDITQLSQDETDLLISLALIPAENHPLKFLAELFAQDIRSLKLALDRLAQKGWVLRKGDNYRLSPVVQSIVLKKNTDLWTQGKKLVMVINGKIRHQDFINLNVKQSEPFVKAAQEIMRNISENDFSLIELLDNMYVFYSSIGDLRRSLYCCELGVTQSNYMNDIFNLGNFYARIGNIYKELVDLDKAMFYQEKYLTISIELDRSFPGNEPFQMGISIAYLKMGDIHLQLGNQEIALDYFQKYTHKLEELVRSSASNVDVKYNLTIGYERLGDLNMQMGDLVGAREYYIKKEVLSEELYQLDPDNAAIKNGLSIAYSKMGDIYIKVGDYDKGHEYRTRETVLNEQLYHSFPDNVKFKSELAIAYLKMGDINNDIGIYDKALEYYKAQIILSEELYQSFDDNMQFKRILAVSYGRIGNVYRNMTDFSVALEFYNKSAILSEELLDSFSDNVELKNGLAVAYEMLGDINLILGNGINCLEYYLKRNKIGKELYDAFPDNVELKDGQAIALSKLGAYYMEVNDKEKAKHYYLECYKSWRELVELSPEDANFRSRLNWVEGQLKRL